MDYQQAKREVIKNTVKARVESNRSLEERLETKGTVDVKTLQRKSIIGHVNRLRSSIVANNPP